MSRNVKLKDIKFPCHIKNDILKREHLEFSSIKIIPNMQYIKVEFHSVFKFNLNSIRRELDIYLFTKENENIDEYPFQLFIRQNITGKIDFKLNAHMTKNAGDIIKFNNMVSLWSEEGLRRLRIHDINCEVLTIVPDKIDVDKIDYVETLKKIMDKVELGTDEIPYINSDELINRIGESKLYLSDRVYCESFISDVRKELIKEQTNISILLKREDSKIIFSRRIGVLPFLVDLDFLNVKPCNKEGKAVLKKILKREIPLILEKFIFDSTPEDYFKELISIFEKEKIPFSAALCKLFTAKGDRPTGKCFMEISKVSEGYWNKHQNITFIIKYADDDINKSIQLNDLIVSEDFINAIPLMQLNENKYLENLAFACYLNKDYKLSLDYCKRAISNNILSITHFTKGLVYLAEQNFEEAYKSYMNGIYLIKNDIWYPVIRNNINIGINNGQIINDDNVKSLINTIELYRRRNHAKLIKNCFCGSKKRYYQCHGKEYIL
ncbi:tetratricopeptide repeat protein [Clostridium estertheticum]|uniref:tetratricopeptide repeat protein n=1 Tax=Clostridium estertheticum TaxID=238834 RepID=UPI001C0C6D6B|nr:tetratricopeptide repeat protein [Clostridium estertheticum]MBU3201564.1 tetratricopeptide repeat protein [Clostridium estertheticum]WAG66264.1 tetratricopeptide repeat protein [Clostridium estertheticum]